MYLIETSPFGNFTQITLKNESTQEHASIIPNFGANLINLVLNNGIQSYQVIDGTVTPHELVINAVYKSSKLAPFPNRINKGKYSFKNQDYELLTNMPPHAIHGLVFDKDFSITSQSATDSEATLSLTYQYQRETVGYPFSFDLQIDYLLNKNGLTMTTHMTNTGTEALPVGDGWHLYFRCPSNIDDCLLTLPSETILVPDATLIPTGVDKPYTDFNTSKIFSNTTFDDCFTISQKNKIAEVVLTDVAHDLSVISWQETGDNKYNFLQIYSPSHRKSLAIEPMTCQPDAFNNGEGVIVLQPQENKQWQCGVKVERARDTIV